MALVTRINIQLISPLLFATTIADRHKRPFQTGIFERHELLIMQTLPMVGGEPRTELWSHRD